MEVNFKMENIAKVPFIAEKVKKVEKTYNEKNANEAYPIAISVIEIICVLIIEKHFHKNINNSAIINLANILKENGEIEIHNLLIALVSKAERLDEYDEYELNFVLISIDRIVEIALEKYPEALS